MKNKSLVWWGWAAGWGIIAWLVLSVSVGFMAGVAQVELPSDYINPISSIVSSVLYVVFLLGVRSFAARKSDGQLIKTVNALVVINIIEMIVLFPNDISRFFDQGFITLLFVALIPLLCVNGIIIMRLADAFAPYVAELGPLGKRIVWWNRVSGWMLASVILCIPGVFFSILAQFFLWRLLAAETKSK